jgi:aminoglycoside phosphotransferase (APT) family kinase protein
VEQDQPRVNECTGNHAAHRERHGAGAKAHCPTPHAHEHHGIAESLAPALIDSLEGKLGPIEWFRSIWQRGGAATGLSTWHETAHADPIPVMVKLPVAPIEYGWTIDLGQPSPQNQEAGAVTPRVIAHGNTIGGYDLAWLILERLPGKPLNNESNNAAFEALIHAAARFQQQAERVRPLAPATPPPDWEKQIGNARERLRHNAMPESQRWNEALKRVQKVLPRLIDCWQTRPINAWCHGDLHLGNAMRRARKAHDTPGDCVLIDLALVHPGHWAEDALYLERQFWGHEQALCGIKPVSALARARRELGLENGQDHSAIANTRRVLAAACVPLLLEREGNARYVHSALELIDRLLPQLHRI